MNTDEERLAILDMWEGDSANDPLILIREEKYT